MKKYDTKLVTEIVESLECAKDSLALLPPTPPDIKRVHFRILNALYKIRDVNGSARVSDISKVSGLLLPNATKVINEMADINIVEKFTSEADKRVVLVRTTDLGEQYIQNYVARFIEDLEKEFAKIDDISCIIMIETIHQVYEAMKTVYGEKETERNAAEQALSARVFY